jgi:hypothetical protein
MARKYNSIWIALKKNGHCAISAHTALHARIVKAVIREKDWDVGFKLLNQENGRMMKLRYEKDGAMIRFFLVQHIYGKLSVKDF